MQIQKDGQAVKQAGAQIIIQAVDTVGITLPVTKHNFFVRDITRLRNETLGMVHRWQERDYNARYYATALSPKTDFPAIARAFGAKGYRADSLSALEAAL